MNVNPLSVPASSGSTWEENITYILGSHGSITKSLLEIGSLARALIISISIKGRQRLEPNQIMHPDKFYFADSSNQ